MNCFYVNAVDTVVGQQSQCMVNFTFNDKLLNFKFKRTFDRLWRRRINFGWVSGRHFADTVKPVNYNPAK
jgi:hypothetical protein